MILRLTLAELRHRPGRALFLLAGYAIGVAVMVTLLAVGEAMLEQSRDRALVGGGDLVVVPAGIDPELLRTGGVESLFLGIDHARFVQRELLEGPRGRGDYGVRAASPVLVDRALEIQAGGRVFRGLGTGAVPSRERAVGAAPRLLAGAWEDSPADERWVSPTPEQLYRQIDRFHLPRGDAAGDSTWAEWHYFNVVLDEDRWVYVTLMVAGEVGTPGRWGGRVLLTVRGADGSHRSLTRDFPCRTAGCDGPGERVRIDTLSPDLVLAEGARVEMEDGIYRVRAAADGARVDLHVVPAPRRYFPPTDLGGSALVSGYVAPALYATAEGTVCLPRCERVEGAVAYHDHNWGVWREVSWEWGAASSERLSLLYGLVRGDSTPSQGLFVYLVDERGPRSLYRAEEVRVTEGRGVAVGGRRVTVPERMEFEDPRRGLRVVIEVQAAHVTDLERPERRYFVQMRGVATVEEAGRAPERVTGFFETYLDGG